MPPHTAPKRTPRNGFKTVLLLSILAFILLAGCIQAPVGDADEPKEEARDETEQTNDETDRGQAPDTTTTDPDRSPDPERDDPPWVGAWLGEWPDKDNRTLNTFHKEAGYRLDTVNLLVSWNTSYESMEATLEHIATAGATPLVTWSPTNLTMDDIQDGTTPIHLDNNETLNLDAYIDAYAEGICTFHEDTGRTVLLEPMPEANGDWHTWAIGYRDPATGAQPNSPTKYVAAWQHVHDRFTDTCPDGAEFVWTVNGVNQGPGTSYLGMYPGEDHTDHVGIRGINLGTHQPQGWAWFGGTFGEAYCALTEETDHDIFLTAVGSVEDGGDKAGWIEEAYLNASSHAWPRIHGIVWYHDDLHVDGETLDVSLASSPAAMDAYRDAIQRLQSGETPDGEPPSC